MTKGSQSALPAAVRRARRARDGQRDDRGAAAEAEAAVGVRADPPGARGTVLRRAAGRQPARTRWPGRRRWSSRAAPSFVDVNLGCPIDYFTSKGLGAALARQPKRVAADRRGDGARGEGDPGDREVQARLERRPAELPRGREGGGGRRRGRARSSTGGRATRATASPPTGTPSARSARAVRVPVVGNGDLLFPHEMEAARARSGCAAVMVARGALIKPWLFREVTDGLPGPLGRGAAGHLPALRGARARALGRPRPRPRARWPTSRAGTSGSGAATRRAGRTAAGRACRNART